MANPWVATSRAIAIFLANGPVPVSADDQPGRRIVDIAKDPDVSRFRIAQDLIGVVVAHRAIGHHPELAADARFATNERRVEHCEALEALILEAAALWNFAKKTVFLSGISLKNSVS